LALLGFHSHSTQSNTNEMQNDMGLAGYLGKSNPVSNQSKWFGRVPLGEQLGQQRNQQKERCDTNSEIE